MAINVQYIMDYNVINNERNNQTVVTQISINFPSNYV